jgi:outer membrane protein insertion porin family
MSKRWVKFSRGVLIGTLIMLGTGPSAAERETGSASVVVDAVSEVDGGEIAPSPGTVPLELAKEATGAEGPYQGEPAKDAQPEKMQEPSPVSPSETKVAEKDRAQESGATSVSQDDQPTPTPPQTEGQSQGASEKAGEASPAEPGLKGQPADEPPAEKKADGEPPAEGGEKPQPKAEGGEQPQPKAEGQPTGAPSQPEEQVEPDDDELEPAPSPRDPVGPPPIVNIEVEGNKSVPTQAILEVVSTRIGDPLLEPRLRRDLQAIFDLGYFTDVRFATPAAPGGLRLVFRVLENPVVDSVAFKGNEVVESTKLRSVMDTETGQILNTRTIHSDIQAINQYYNEDLGYLRTPTHVTDVAFENGQLVLTIVDGIVVSGVEVTGVTVFPKEKVAGMIRVKPGDLFNRKTLEEDLSKINDLYEEDQWVLDTVDPKIDPDTGEVTVAVVEAEVEEIRVEGNTKTRTATILRNLRTKPGTVLNRRRFQKDLERLNNLGYFRKVEPDPQRGSERGKVILVLDVEEEKTGLATIGVGYAGGGSSGIRSGVTGAVSYSDRNLFGQGKNVSLSWQRGAQISSIGFSFLDPAINGNQDSIGLSLFKNDVDGLRQPIIVDGQQQFAFYDDQRIGGSLTYGHPLNDDLRIFGTLRHETIEILRDSSSQFQPVGLGTGTLGSVGLSALYDTRDDIFNPHVGSFANGSVNVAGLYGDFDFNKYTLEGRHYIPLGKKHTLALRAWGGIVTGDAPITEFFYAGGPDTLRGYEQNRFFGTRFFVANAEYRFPIFNVKFLRGAVFADAGTAFSPGDNINNRIYYDAGVGLRITFPALGLGVIRLDYAVGDEGGRTQIGIGQSF